MKRFVIYVFVLILASCAGMKQAQQFYDQKNYQAAITECLRAIEKDSSNADAFLILGKSYRAMSKNDQALSALKTAEKIKPNSNLAEEAQAEIIAIKLGIGKQAAKEENFNRAFSEYKEILAMDSTNFEANFYLAQAYAANGWLKKAKIFYLKALAIDSSNGQAKSALARADSLMRLADANFQKGKKYYLRGKNISASKYLKRAINLQRDHSEANYYYHMAQGKILFRKGSKSALWDAIEHFGKAMMIHEEFAAPHFYMAQAYEKKDRNEFDNAISEYKLALEKEPSGKYAKKCKRKIRELTARRNKLRRFWGK
ncbi:MAG: tetratricopeptide repeat protein [Calditrichaeota bacterium]|nr:tetratricopeptide repeat protein [Calditrichota bacterium]